MDDTAIFTGLTTVNFERIARAIGLLTAHWREQPELPWVAEQVGLSEFHLQRLFSRWVGVSPKRFVQFLTKEAARRHLADAATLIDAALACGLSGSARLHDLFVRYEGMTPGDFKASVQGQPMDWGDIDTPFGRALAVFAPRGLHRLEFAADDDQRDRMLGQLQSTYPDARWQKADVLRLATVERAFQIPLSTKSFAVTEGSVLSLCVSGSVFQLKVWEALLAVPPGKAVSYGGLANALGFPDAARAVGRAVGANAIAWLIPCHRVIRETGAAGPFRWGSDRKRAMLGWERAKTQDSWKSANDDPAF